MNEVLKAISERYSCRDFTGVPLAQGEIQAIAAAAAEAPSANNSQRWRIYAITSKPLIDELEAEGMSVMANMPDKSMYERIQSRGGKLFYSAPALFIVAIEKAAGAGAVLDCGIVCENIAIAAAGIGAQSCICGLAGLAFSAGKRDSFARRIGFPEGYEFGIAVLLGREKSHGAPHAPDLSKISYIA
ncbi:MAG: nitroreductase family protein [Clostridiales bacterium]|jgi:nitroreductase|nr:nitroreductase family protein [Clostridiales bacterium]